MQQSAGGAVAGQPGQLPQLLTSFIGREQELADLDLMLADPGCRLITLIGHGGIGKTRLAIQAASAAASRFADGVVFVNLQPVTSADFVVPAMASALDFPLSSSDAPVTQLARYLSDKSILLLMDNAEHVDAGMSALSDLLQQTPHVKALVTSRQALKLTGEWLYSVRGLPLPPDTWDVLQAPEQVDVVGALQLFTACARRMRPRFSLSDDREREAAVRICRLVEGMPLAIELAAAWVKTLSVAEIADELERNLDMLTASARDVPERHRSMQAMFEQSWVMLTPQEQSAFERLSVFRGGFRRDAGEKVAGASLTILSSLVDKSLLRWDVSANGRYQIHEVLRQFGESHLAQTSQEAHDILDLHANYYADFLHRRLPDMLGHRQREVVSEIEHELENIRAAWDWMVKRGDVGALNKSARSYAAYGQMRCRYLEVAQALERAIGRLDAMAATTSTGTREIDAALAPMLSALGWIYIRFGRYAEVEAVLQRCRAINERLGIPPVEGAGTDPALGLGLVAALQGDYAGALRLGDAALRTAQVHGHDVNRAYAYSVLANAAQAMGDYEQALAHAQQCYALTQQTGDRWFAPHSLLGNAAIALGDYPAAKSHFESFYAIRKEFNDAGGMANALNRLGRVALLQGDSAEAQLLFGQSLHLYRDVNDQGGRATSLHGLGSAAAAVGDYEAARQHLGEALRIGREIQYAPLIFLTLAEIGRLLLEAGQTERGLEALALVLQQPACPREIQELCQSVFHGHAAEAFVKAQAWAEAARRGREASLDAVCESLHAMRTMPIVDAQANAAQSGPIVARPDQALVEPLTSRELDVLRLLGAGLRNADIAQKLVISVGTVKAYTSQIYGKLGVNSRTQAIVRARELKLIA